MRIFPLRNRTPATYPADGALDCGRRSPGGGEPEPPVAIRLGSAPKPRKTSVLAGAMGRSRVSRNPRRLRCAWGLAAEAGRSEKVRRMLVAIAGVAIAVIATAAARASQLIDRDAKTATLQVNSKGEAMVSFTAAGKAKHVLAWGAVNALPPKKGGKQVSFKLDYSGGYGKYKKANYWNGFGGCPAYDGPALAWKVT